MSPSNQRPRPDSDDPRPYADDQSPREEQAANDRIEAGAASPIERRLRATLDAASQQEPISPELDRLRTDVSRKEESLPAASSRRSGPRAIVLAAAMALVAVAVFGAVRGLQRTQSDTERAAAPPSSGFLLPGSESGFEVTSIGARTAPPAGLRRQVRFEMPDPLDDDGNLDVEVTEMVVGDVALPDLSDGGLEPIDSGAADGRWLVTGIGENASRATVVTHLDDRLLTITAPWPPDVVPVESLIEVSERWASDAGRPITLDVAEAYVTSDTTVANPGVVPEQVLLGEEPDEEDPAPAEAEVDVKADGWSAHYSLSPPGRGALPTGLGDDDKGEAAGVVAASRPQPLNIGLDLDAFLVEGQLLVVRFPGADLQLRLDDFRGPAPNLEQAISLVRSVRPVPTAAWAAVADRVPARWTVECCAGEPTWGATLDTSTVITPGNFGLPTPPETDDPNESTTLPGAQPQPGQPPPGAEERPR